jgi:Rrf2 family protein
MKKSYIAAENRNKENKVLSQTAVYALLAMGFIATNRNGKPVLTKTIAAGANIPQNFLSKIMNRLVQAGYLNSVRGTNGGFTLSRPADTISLREIVDLFMPSDSFTGCFLGRPECDGNCSLHEQWAPIAERFLSLLEKTTIDQVHGGENKLLQAQLAGSVSSGGHPPNNQADSP